MSTRDADRWITEEKEKHHKFDLKLARRYGATLAAVAFSLEEACVDNVGKADTNGHRYKHKGRYWQRWTAATVRRLCPYVGSERAALRALKKLSSGPRSLFIRSKHTGLNVGSDRAIYYALRDKPGDRDLHTFLLADANLYGVDAATMLYRIRFWWRINHNKFMDTGDPVAVGPDNLIEHRLVFADLMEVQPYLSLTTAKRILGLLEAEGAVKVRREEINSRRIEVYVRHPFAKSVKIQPDEDVLDDLDSDYLPGDPAEKPVNRLASFCSQDDSDLSTKVSDGRPDRPMDDQSVRWKDLEASEDEDDLTEKNSLQSSKSKPAVASLPPALPIKENTSKLTPVADATVRLASSTLCERPKSKVKVVKGLVPDRSRFFSNQNAAHLKIVSEAMEALYGVSDHPGSELKPAVNRRLVKVNATDQ